MEQRKTAFIPQEHGLRFVNSFAFPFSTTFQLPFSGAVDLGDIIYGLCGGMCFTALDYFNLGKPVPEVDSVEELSTNYLLYLWNRQLDSFGLLTIPKVIEWMIRNDIDVAKRTARYEVPKLRRRIDKGEPVVLALIRTEHGDSPTKNHQVLATGYTINDDKRMLIDLYDPNHPGKNPQLSIDLSRPSLGLDASQTTGEPLRGFFMIKYWLESPPDIVVD